MFTKRVILWGCVLWLMVPLFTYAATQLHQVKQLTVTLNSDDGMTVDWKAVTGAKQYRVRLLRGSKVIKTKSTSKSITTLPASLFKANRSYTVKVRVLATAKKAASEWRSKTFTYEPVAQPPALTEAEAPTSLPGGAVWLFFIDDGEEQLAVSTEAGQTIKMGRFDPANPTASIDWQTVASSADTGGQSIADHWHIFAHGYHWMVFSTANTTQSYLLQLTTDFEQVALVEVAQNDLVNSTSIATNDMFLVEEADGVTVGHFYPGYGHQLYRFNTSAELIDTTTIGGDAYVHGNGATAYQTDSGFTVFAPSDLNPSTASPLYKMTFDTNWEPVSITTLLEIDDTDYAMGAATVLTDGSYILHARKIDNVSSHTGNDDSGSIVQYRFASDDTLVDSAVITETGNRPHTLKVGDDLYLTYDTSNAIYYARYQIE